MKERSWKKMQEFQDRLCLNVTGVLSNTLGTDVWKRVEIQPPSVKLPEEIEPEESVEEALAA